MKRIILFIAISASIFCACQKNVGYIPTRQENLQNYALELFYDKVVTPTLALDIAYELQVFLNMDKEARKIHKFANVVTQYDLNKYAILLPGGLAGVVVDTKGRYLYEPGAKWEIYLETEALFKFFQIESLYDTCLSEANICLECTGVGQWRVTDGRSGISEMVLDEDNSDERVWLAKCKGNETDEEATGIQAQYLTCDFSQSDDNFTISLQKNAVTEKVENYCFDGIFLVTISSFGQEKERAFVVGRPGFILNCFTEVNNL